MNHGGQRTGAGRPKGQGRYGTSTKAIRVPDYLVEDIQDYSLHGGYKILLIKRWLQSTIF